VRASTLPTLRIMRVLPQHATKKQRFHEGYAALASRGVQTCLQFPRERWRQVYGIVTIYVCYFAVASCIAYAAHARMAGTFIGQSMTGKNRAPLGTTSRFAS